MTTWGHNDLAADLAGHLRTEARMVWTDMQLGPQGSPRPDVYTMFKSYTNPRPTAYEVKVSRSDFIADVTAGKWQSYLRYAGSVIFAAPLGVLNPAEVPKTCGLMVRSESGWKTMRRAIPQPCTMPQDAWLKLLIDGVNREGGTIRRDAGALIRMDKHATRIFGRNVAKQLRDAEYANSRITYADMEAAAKIARAEDVVANLYKRLADEAPTLWRSLLEVLSLPADTEPWAAKRVIEDLRTLSAPSVPAFAVRNVLHSMQRDLTSLGRLIGEPKEDADA